MPRPTPTQLAALHLIADGDVTAYEFRAIGRTRIHVPDGRPIGVATFRALERDGLVERDQSTGLHQGQAVSVTRAGRAVLDNDVR